MIIATTIAADGQNGLTLAKSARRIVDMNLLRISKFTITAALCSCLLMGFKTTNPTQSPLGLGQSHSANDSSAMWANMGEHFTLEHYASRSEVNAQIAILQRDPSELYHILQTKAPCISYVYEQTQRRGLPAELALLPVIESDFNPNAHSKAGARGLWQLMPHTASDLGLKNSQAYDGRRDIIASTDAALNYLNYLHESFKGDWLLAMAAYNDGPGRIQNAIQHQGSWFNTSAFWDLHHIPLETREYVPKLLAVAEVIKNPAQYHMQLPTIQNTPHLATVQVGSKVDLKQVALNTGMSIEAMRQLNPGYRNLATTKGSPNKLLVPADKAASVGPAATIIASNNFDTKPTLADLQPKIENSHLLSALLNEGKWLSFTLSNIST